ncbi:unnamed protein product [Closterium sp. NIES-54]
MGQAAPRRPAAPRRQEPSRATSATPATAAISAATSATPATAATAAMASPTILTFDAEGRAVDVDVWVDDLQLFLQCDSKDGVSLFDHTSGVSPAPAATADSTVRSQWTTRDAVAHLAVRSHLPSSERAHFGHNNTAKSLYDAVIARYSSPATAALSRLMLLYLFLDLAAFATVADLIAHLRTSDARYRSALPTEFYAKNPPPMYITLYYLVTRLSDSLASAWDHFLSLCPTELTVDLLEELLTAAEKSIIAVGASRGDPRAPFFEGCSPVPLLPSVASAAAVDLVRTEEVGAASAPSGRCRNSKGKGARVVEGTVGAVVEAVEEAEGVAVEVGVVAGVGASVAAVGVVEAAAAAVKAAAAVVEVAAAVVLVEAEPRSMEALVVASASSSRFPVRPCRPSSFFLDAVELPRWGDLLRHNVAIFDLYFDAILATMYAVTDSAEGECYLCVPPNPGIEAAALGASAFAAPGTSEFASPGACEFALSGTAFTEALHTFTLDSGSPSFFRDSTTLTPLSRHVAVSLADPSGGPVLAHSSTVLPCPAAPSGLLSGLHLPSFSTNLVSGADIQDLWVDQFTPGGQHVTHCTYSRTGRHLTTFTRRPRSSLYTLTTASPPVNASSQVPLSLVSPGPSLPFLQGLPLLVFLVSRADSAPLLTPPTCVRGQDHERYFQLVVDDYSRYTTVFPLRSKGEVTEVLIDWIRGARCQLSERFGSNLPFLHLHSERGGEFSSDLLMAFCRAEGIRQTFTLPASPQQNGIAERRIGMAMDVTRASMIHAAAPHFLWPFVVQYAAYQVNLQPLVSWPETTPTLRWTGKVGDASVFRVWGSQAFIRDTSADKLSSRAVPCVFLGFPPEAPGWQFYHSTSRRVLSSQDVTFVESVSYYRLFPYCAASLPPPPLFLAPVVGVQVVGVRGVRVRVVGIRGVGVRVVGIVVVSALDGAVRAGPAPSGVSQVDLVELVEVALDSGAARGAEPAGAEPRGAELESVEPGGAEPGGAESRGAEPVGAEPERAESGGPPSVPSWREPLSP